MPWKWVKFTFYVCKRQKWVTDRAKTIVGETTGKNCGTRDKVEIEMELVL